MNEPEQQHSPLPWKKDGYEIFDAHGKTVTQISSPTRTDEGDAANRDLILRAVNSYDRLRSALEEALDWAFLQTEQTPENKAKMDKLSRALEDAK